MESTFALVIPPTGQEPTSTGLSQILSLVRSSDSVAIKSEGTRVLVNVIKSLWSSNVVTGTTTSPVPSPPNNPDNDHLEETQGKRKEAIRIVLEPDYVLALASLVGRSGKYPILVNEGVVALSLLSTHKDGGKPKLTLCKTWSWC